MKKLLILLLSALSLTVYAQQKKVAVYVTGEQSGITKVLGDQLVVAFAKSGKYTAIERTSNFLAELSKEQNYQRSGAVNDNDIARLGVQFGVNYVCVADMSDVFGEKYISARLIDVETAEVLNAHNVTGKMSSMNECLEMASEIADYLSKGTIAEQEERRKIMNKGYVDLGLPSGTYWRDIDEEGGECNYDEAVEKYGSSLPSQEQWEELMRLCTWAWTSYNRILITGVNGNTIYLYAKGYYNPLTESQEFEDMCCYWSSTKLLEYDNDAYCINRHESHGNRFTCDVVPTWFVQSVRLVQKL